MFPLFMLSLYCTLFTFIYSIWTHPIVHQVCILTKHPVYSTMQVMYGILVVLILLQAAYILNNDRDMVSIKLFILGLVTYGVGFLLWNFGK